MKGLAVALGRAVGEIEQVPEELGVEAAQRAGIEHARERQTRGAMRRSGGGEEVVRDPVLVSVVGLAVPLAVAVVGLVVVLTSSC